MKIEFYHTILCPRCLLAKRALGRLLPYFPGITVETIEITASPERAWSAGIRMVPALKLNNATLTGFTLNETRIRNFIEAAIAP